MHRDPQHFDAIVIGTGQAGPTLAVDLAKAGYKVAVFERNLFGGTCVNTGCMPTKTLVATARVAHVVTHAADYGIDTTAGTRIDMHKVKARKDKVSTTASKGVEDFLRGTEGCSVFNEHARFVDDHTVQAGDTLFTAPKIFINVGGRAAVPPIKGLDEISYLTNSSMMQLDFLPEHLAIVGGSYIALEFAQMYRRFGSRVTLLQRGSQLVSREDADVASAMQGILENEGIDIRLNVDQIAVAKSGQGIEIRFASTGTDTAIQATHMLIATGRQPNTDDLGVHNTSIKLDDDGYMAVDDQLRTTAPGIWALGDCNRRGAFTHTAYNDYEIVAANLLHNDPRRVTDRYVAYAMFTDPPLARIGMTEAEVRRSGRKALIGTRSMQRVGRAVERGETAGFIKILVDAESKHILGASILGIEGDEAIHCILDVMYAQQPYTTLQRAVHIHPTVSELIPTVLGDLKPLR
jgi:pyruvate/2-oxoglutarate dehydrogenase complex dihydrolipoamide dehydrogenase (E3) component